MRQFDAILYDCTVDRYLLLLLQKLIDFRKLDLLSNKIDISTHTVCDAISRSCRGFTTIFYGLSCRNRINLEIFQIVMAASAILLVCLEILGDSF
jgi:hypothetical protein